MNHTTNWPNEYIMYGMIQPKSPREIWVYKDRLNYIRVQTNLDIERAVWAGSALLVYFRDGSCRRYFDYINYERIGPY
jgi:hypothetical protein